MFQNGAGSPSEHPPTGHPTALGRLGLFPSCALMGLGPQVGCVMNEGARGAVFCLQGLEEVMGTRNISH